MEVVSAVTIADIEKAADRLAGVALQTPLELSHYLSEKYGAHIWLKREDQQVTRSYKIRGAYNKLSMESDGQKTVLAASAGNHAQGVAYACNLLNRKGVIFMPLTTPKQKIEQAQFFGGQHIDIQLVGDNFDDAYQAAKEYYEQHDACFIPPFDDADIICGQGTVGLEIIRQMDAPIDYLLLPIGGGGLSAGVSTVFKSNSASTTIIGVEPTGAPAMAKAFEAGHPVTLDAIDPFVDGAAVRRIGEL
ncbi:MAG: pyridoxal-phosphate dependent enzyme, partial [Saprospiraceae bacterium]|nr:pyridoxal-phosphate dependent enzyme [Saprospiraceae bacterium]